MRKKGRVTPRTRAPGCESGPQHIPRDPSLGLPTSGNTHLGVQGAQNGKDKWIRRASQKGHSWTWIFFFISTVPKL